MKHLYLSCALLIVLFSGCRKEPDYEAIDLAYDYFPNLTDSFIEYQVNTIVYGTTNDTLQYLLREYISESFIDAIGHPSTRVERSVRSTINEPYQLVEVWSQKRTTTAVERVEDNQRFIRFIFPPEKGRAWNGNAYNTLDEWNYEFVEIGVPRTIGAFTFDETAFIQQRDNVNLVEQQVAYEVYARGVGLIEKYYRNLSFQGGQIVGEETEMRVIGFGSFN